LGGCGFDKKRLQRGGKRSSLSILGGKIPNREKAHGKERKEVLKPSVTEGGVKITIITLLKGKYFSL